MGNGAKFNFYLINSDLQKLSCQREEVQSTDAISTNINGALHLYAFINWFF